MVKGIGVRAVKNDIVQGAGRCIVIKEIVKIVLIQVDLVAGLHGVREVGFGGSGGGFRGRNDHRAVHITARIAVGPERQLDFILKALIGHKGQLVQIVFLISLVIAAIVIEGTIRQVAGAEAHLIPAAVIVVKGTIREDGGVGTVENHIVQSIARIGLFHHIVKIVFIKIDIAAGPHLISNILAAAGAHGIGAHIAPAVPIGVIVTALGGRIYRAAVGAGQPVIGAVIGIGAIDMAGRGEGLNAAGAARVAFENPPASGLAGGILGT